MGQTTSNESDIAGKKIVFTGFRDAALKTVLEKAGCKVMTAVSKQTDILLHDGYSPKAIKWSRQGVATMQVWQFSETYLRKRDRLEYKQLCDQAIKTLTKNTTEYLTHDNGGRAFRIVHTSDQFEAFACHFNAVLDECLFNKRVVKATNYVRLFVGEDTDGSAFGKGNSVLLQLSDHKYMFIGESIFTFESKDAIHTFKSPIGNSDVPYPYAIGANTTYLMAEQVVVSNEHLLYAKPGSDPYDEYYDSRRKKYFKKFGFKIVSPREQ